ncbi:MAG: hypothetical protein KDK70_05815 [Myxococcales bacterium]|nr:hypothetical protein [Myxococcales bacterium]
MIRIHTMILLLGALTLPACFTTDGAHDIEDDDDDDDDDDAMASEAESGGESDGEDQGEGPVCTELEDACEVNGDCPCFDGSSDAGTGLCVGNGETGQCTTICQGHGDCASGCCAALEGDVEYGACAPTFVCEGQEPSALCIDGVALFCACAAAAGVDCTEDELAAFAATCSDVDHALYSVFECWGGHASGGLEACMAGLDACEIE